MVEGPENRRLTEEQSARLKSIGIHLPRQRHQDGHVTKEGKRPRWKGHYFVYELQPDGQEKRIHRKVDLGSAKEKPALTKAEAKEKLRGIIGEVTGVKTPVAPSMSLREFWQERYKPIRLATWKITSQDHESFVIERYVLGKFGDTPLGKLNKFDLQLELNRLAAEFSKSVVKQFRKHLGALLEEAVDQDLIPKNPARKLRMPETKDTCHRFLSRQELTDLFAVASDRDRLIIELFTICGLRPGELFALRRNDVDGQRLRVDETASVKHGPVDPKTPASRAHVWLPERLAQEIKAWMGKMDDQSPEAYLFGNLRGKPINRNNFLNRDLKRLVTAAIQARKEAGLDVPAGYLEGVNPQAFRRTCATWAMQGGDVKDVQSMLRHAHPGVTAEVYIQAIPESVQRAVEALDEKLKPTVHNCSQAAE